MSGWVFFLYFCFVCVRQCSNILIYCRKSIDPIDKSLESRFELKKKNQNAMNSKSVRLSINFSERFWNVPLRLK